MEDKQNLGVILLSDVSMQASLLQRALGQGIERNVIVVGLEQLVEEQSILCTLGDIILFDYHYLTDEKFEYYNLARLTDGGSMKEIVINCPKDVPSTQLFKWRNLVGVFYVDDEIELLLKGMEKIIQDEMWLSRKVAQDYIEHFRCANNVETSQAYTNLTKREKEIMLLLGHGVSNLQIAEELAVSENTVKTHLHNIFKKINAKNRLQALLWANNNIALEERV
ncbi:LuxR C-terminal-related transcriptional regulator [Vibrio ostreicida]|uniref:LuxR C-terminal-related transcriptional regulator n=1 Tax=Vibrio ostreicida TaxID=526588 RepID=A0ABT8BZ14_9VIBR|nr:LuxR C-terminal-related transcriptional regulator [Vibrio ostreicida]MDN3612401.1 LuxR C-terminal-related transcriptional regulator [Vibrio ostreicida]NPD09830.1 helix-turn-helix transcriptional regulator [Vibrio ostreicida]